MKNSNMFISLHSVPFSRRGSFFTFMLDPLSEEGFGMSDLYLSSCRAAAAKKGNRHINLRTIHDGIEVPYALSSTKSELIMDTDYGRVSFCIAEQGLVLGTSTGGVGLRCQCAFNIDMHEMAKEIKNGRGIEIDFSDMPAIVVSVINGSRTFDAPWNWRDTSSYSCTLDLLPASDGKLDFAIEEFFNIDGDVRDSYPEYQASVQSVEEDFADFMRIVPDVTDPVCLELYERAAWTSWAHLVGPSGNLKREMMAMMLYYISLCASWQQSYQAITFSKDPNRSWDFLLSMFDYQQPDGHVPAFIMDTSGKFGIQQSPFQGFATCWLLTHADFSSIPKDELKKLYEHLCALTNWWITHRIGDDGIPMYMSPDESGWDDATIYIYGCTMKTPDLCTYLVFQYEAQKRLAQMIGGMEAETARFSAEADKYLKLMIDNFWDGEHFCAIAPDGNKVFTKSICLYQPLLLGKRLPDEIVDKMVSSLMVEDHLLTPYGFASEDITSPYVDPYKGWMCGPVIAPVQFMINIGLEECGRLDLARETARRYCHNLVKQGTLLHIINPFDGTPQLKGRDNVQRQPWTSWCSSVFLFLSSRYCS